MDDLIQSAEAVARVLQTIVSLGGLRLRFRVTVKPGKSAERERRADISVDFTGPDMELLTTRNGELLNALEHIAVKVLRLEPEEHDRVSFDAGDFKADRDERLRASALIAIEQVRATGKPYAFQPMTSRERRLLHLMLHDSNLLTASRGEGPGRFVVLYPAGADTGTDGSGRDVSRVRAAFRPR